MTAHKIVPPPVRLKDLDGMLFDAIDQYASHLSDIMREFSSEAQHLWHLNPLLFLKMIEKPVKLGARAAKMHGDLTVRISEGPLSIARMYNEEAQEKLRVVKDAAEIIHHERQINKNYTWPRADTSE